MLSLLLNMDNIEIVCAENRDLDQILILLNEITESIRSTKGWNSYSLSTQKESQRKIFLEILKSEGRLFVAKYNGRIVGLVNMQVVYNIRHGWKRAHLEEVVVNKEFRRNSIGSKLIKAVANYCKDNNIGVIKLLCGKQLKTSLKFYKTNGFKFTDEGLRLDVK